MLPTYLKLPNSTAFTETVKNGQRKGTRTVVVYLAKQKTTPETPRYGGPRFGFIVSKAVGNAVIRHRVTRRLRHVCAALSVSLSSDLNIVIRALPRSATASSEQLCADVRRSVKKLQAT